MPSLLMSNNKYHKQSHHLLLFLTSVIMTLLLNGTGVFWRLHQSLTIRTSRNSCPFLSLIIISCCYPTCKSMSNNSSLPFSWKTSLHFCWNALVKRVVCQAMMMMSIPWCNTSLGLRDEDFLDSRLLWLTLVPQTLSLILLKTTGSGIHVTTIFIPWTILLLLNSWVMMIIFLVMSYLLDTRLPFVWKTMSVKEDFKGNLGAQIKEIKESLLDALMSTKTTLTVNGLMSRTFFILETLLLGWVCFAWSVIAIIYISYILINTALTTDSSESWQKSQGVFLWQQRRCLFPWIRFDYHSSQRKLQKGFSLMLLF